MKGLLVIYKNETILIAFIGSLILWAVTMSFLAFQNKTQVILIGNKEGSYQLIKEGEKDPLETENFIRHFLGLTLNFDEKSYNDNISLAGDLMTENLWERKKSDFTEMAGFIKKHKVIQSSELLEITKIKTNNYEVKVRNYLFKKGILTKKEKLLSLSLTENTRSFENPWRYSVSEIEVK